MKTVTPKNQHNASKNSRLEHSLWQKMTHACSVCDVILKFCRKLIQPCEITNVINVENGCIHMLCGMAHLFLDVWLNRRARLQARIVTTCCHLCIFFINGTIRDNMLSLMHLINGTNCDNMLSLMHLINGTIRDNMLSLMHLINGTIRDNMLCI
jgi:hypothetical protein